MMLSLPKHTLGSELMNLQDERSGRLVMNEVALNIMTPHLASNRWPQQQKQKQTKLILRSSEYD